jgi:flagellin
MTVINTNVASLYAQAAITTNARQMTTTMQQLSTGKRVNGAADDAAGIAISAKLTSQIRGLNQAIRNANDAISMIQTAEGATDAITNMLQRMRELTIQSGNASYSNDDRKAMANEYDALALEIDRVADTTKWNGFPVLNGTAGSSGTFMFDVVFQAR